MFQLEPDYLIGRRNADLDSTTNSRIVFRDISNSTNTRTFIAAVIPMFPCGNKVPILDFRRLSEERKLFVGAQLSGLLFDWQCRIRMAATQLNWHIVEALALPHAIPHDLLVECCAQIALTTACLSASYLSLDRRLTVRDASLLQSRRLSQRLKIDAVSASLICFDQADIQAVMLDSDYPKQNVCKRLSKGFWRVDKDKDPELRHTVLTIIAFHDLQKKIEECGGDRDKGIEAFLNQNNGEGWMLPETLRLADYGLGHDDRALEHQPVASRLGPRFYDWQLAQTAEESWRECHLHARNMLGADEYQRLLDRIEAEKRGEVWVDERDNTNTAEIKTTSRPEHQIGMGI
jgi:hypothetical protein